MKRLLTVVLTLLLVGCASVPPAENVSYPVQTDENVQNNVQNSDSESETVDAPIVEEAVEEDVSINDDYVSDNENTQDSAENDDLGEPNQVEEDSREDAKTEEPETVDAPIVEEYALSYEIVEDDICKLREVSSHRTSGPWSLASSFPSMRGVTVPLTGTINWKIVFLEWEDLRGTQSDYDYHVREVEKTREFYRVMSEGKLNLNMSYEQSWSMVSGSYADSYIPDNMSGGDWRSVDYLQVRVNRFIAATDPQVDYSGVDVIFFAFPREKTVVEGGGLHVFGHANHAVARTQEGNIGNMFSLGDRSYDNDSSQLGWATLAHEFGHTLGMPDLRDVSGGYRVPLEVVNPIYGFDIMDNQDAGNRSISGWLKWVQGWLSDSQVTCVEKESIEGNYYKINNANPVGTPDELLVIRLSGTKALVVESRRWDRRFDLPVSNSRDGVIVYRVDATKGHSEGPLKLLSPRDISQYLAENNVWPDWRVLDVMLFEGDSVTFEGVTVEVKSLSSGSDVVYISK